MLVISDTSPITNLLKVNRLNLLKDVFGSVIIPDQVNRELLAWKEGGADISSYQDAGWIEVAKPCNNQLFKELQIHLDIGEAEAIALAKEMKAEFLLIDERKGRKIARSLNLNAVGLIGVLLEAKRRGFVEKVAPILDELRSNAGFWISDAFYNQVLSKAEE